MLLNKVNRQDPDPHPNGKSGFSVFMVPFLPNVSALIRYLLRLAASCGNISAGQEMVGAKLRSSDLALARITAKWRHSLQTFLTFQSVCAKVGFDLDLAST